MGTIRTKLMCYLKDVSKLPVESRAAGVDLELIQQKHFHIHENRTFEVSH